MIIVKKETISNKALSILKYYYSDILATKFDSEDEKAITTGNTIEYLLDNNFSMTEIINEFWKIRVDSISYSDLPERFWKNSLTKKGAFYLHHELRLESKSPQYNFSTNTTISYLYYCEMKLRYTENDLLSYFHKNMSQFAKQLEDERYNRDGLRKLMQKYSRLDYVEPIDVILCSIDNHLKQDPDCYRIIDISLDNQTTIEELIANMQELEAKDLRKMVPRRKWLT